MNNTKEQPLYDYRDLGANVLWGTNSFVPSGIVQWILVVIFVFIGVILVRKIFHSDKKYKEKPMKHD